MFVAADNDDSLEEFTESLSKFTRYSSLRPLATLNYASDIYNTSSIVSRSVTVGCVRVLQTKNIMLVCFMYDQVDTHCETFYIKFNIIVVDVQFFVDEKPKH